MCLADRHLQKIKMTEKERYISYEQITRNDV